MTTKTATKPKAKVARKPKAGAKVTRTKGRARLADLKKTSEEDETAAILATLDEDAAETSEMVLGEAATVETVDKAAVYEAQESALEVDDTDKPAKAKKSRKKRTNAEGKPARAVREINMERLGEIYEDPNKIIAGIDTLPKKVQDKARNALLAMSCGSRLSQYTQFTIEALQLAGGNTVEVGLIRDILEKRGYKPGTASAQAQQQMSLLPFLGVAERSGRILTLIESDATKALTA